MSKYNPISEERKKERRDNIIKELKAMIFPTVILLIIVGFFVFVMNYQAKNSEEEIIEVHAYDGDGKDIEIENEYLKMTFNATTTNFDIKNKKTGKVWHSVPEGGADDTLAINEEKNKLQSSLILDYSTENGLETYLDSWSFSAQNGIYQIESGEDYITVNYSLGKVQKEYVIPPVMLADRFLEITGSMDISSSENVKQFYKKMDINDLGKKDNKEELLEKFPDLANNVCYILREKTSANADPMKESAKKSLQKCFEDAGYTYEEYLVDKERDLSESVNSNPVFNVSVTYRLEGKDLVVEVPLSSLESQSLYPIYTLNVLPFFGAGGKSDDGYIVLPEGGGSIVNFNNGKVSQSTYYSNLYGWDMCLYRPDVVHSTLASMNLYGISDNKNDSFICILEDGASYASIKADISGKTNSFNYVSAEYSIKPREKYDLGEQANAEMYEYLREIPQDESLVKRYRFVNSSDYIDMAEEYRNYLIEKYPGEFEKLDDSSTPVLLEVVGAVDKVKQIVGVPVSRPLPLTTYEEAAGLIKDVKESGIDNLSVKYTGWANGGVKQHYMKRAKRVWALGSNKDLANLSATASSLGVDLYLDGMTDYEYRSNIFEGFFSFRDAAKFLSRKRAELVEYSDVTFAARDDWGNHYLLHGDKIIDQANVLVDKTQSLGTGVSFQNIGKELSSDFYRKDYTSRDEQMDMQVDLLKSASDAGQKIMINEGNSYAVPYSDFISNMDLRGSEYTIIDECVPFYQIALHGYKNYSGYPINTCGDTDSAILYAAEYGAGLSFSVMKESTFTLQKTLYTEYYASDIDEWGDKMMAIYNRFNTELGHTYNQEMVAHNNINSEVSVTEYEDGTKVYVNYGYTDYSGNGVNVPSRDYLVVR